MILVNAGANKGYAVAEFFRRFVGHEGPTAAEWRANLTSVKRNLFLPCGFCRACSESWPVAPRPARGASAHAFELLPTNAWVLGKMFERLRVPAELHNVALGNFSGEVYAPRAFRTGQENVPPARHGARPAVACRSRRSTPSPARAASS